jgi:hypothetical protein
MEAGRAWRQTSCGIAYRFVCLAEIQGVPCLPCTDTEWSVFAALQRYRVFPVCLAQIQNVLFAALQRYRVFPVCLAQIQNVLFAALQRYRVFPVCLAEIQDVPCLPSSDTECSVFAALQIYRMFSVCLAQIPNVLFAALQRYRMFCVCRTETSIQIIPWML